MRALGGWTTCSAWIWLYRSVAASAFALQMCVWLVVAVIGGWKSEGLGSGLGSRQSSHITGRASRNKALRLGSYTRRYRTLVLTSNLNLTYPTDITTPNPIIDGRTKYTLLSLARAAANFETSSLACASCEQKRSQFGKSVLWACHVLGSRQACRLRHRTATGLTKSEWV